jgi:dimethylargininase
LVGPEVLLVTEEFARREAFAPYERVVVDEDEAYAANVVWVNGALLVTRGYPKIRQKLAARGLRVVELDASEMHKMDGGLTCLSLRF